MKRGLMRILVQALVAAPGGVLTVLRDLIAAWSPNDELLIVCWRPEANATLTSTGRTIACLPSRSTEEALIRLRYRPPSVIRDFQPDVVWSQAVRVDGFAAPQAVHYQDIGSFIDIHPRTLRQTAKRLREFTDLRRAHLRIYNSNTLRDAVITRYPRATAMPDVVIHNGLDLAPFFAANAAGGVRSRDGAARTVLLPQSDAPHKRNHLAIDVLVRLRELDPDAPPVLLTVAGRGDYPGLREAAKRHGLERALRFTGYVDRARMANLYVAHDAVLMTAAAESFGNPIVEAHAVGKPVVTPPLRVATELAGPLCRIASTHDASSLAHELRAALMAKPERPIVEEAQLFASEFSADGAARKLRTALAGLMKPAGFEVHDHEGRRALLRRPLGSSGRRPATKRARG